MHHEVCVVKTTCLCSWNPLRHRRIRTGELLAQWSSGLQVIDLSPQSRPISYFLAVLPFQDPRLSFLITRVMTFVPEPTQIAHWESKTKPCRCKKLNQEEIPRQHCCEEPCRACALYACHQISVRFIASRTSPCGLTMRSLLPVSKRPSPSANSAAHSKVNPRPAPKKIPTKIALILVAQMRKKRFNIAIASGQKAIGRP